MSTDTTTSDGTEVPRKAREAAEGLRQLADLIERHPELAKLADNRLLMYVAEKSWSDAEPVGARFARLARALGGTRTKDSDDQYVRVIRKFGPITAQVYAGRKAVCERVVVGTETVEVPDPNAPKVLVEREVVEWKCQPIGKATS